MNKSDSKVYRELFPEEFNSRHHAERDAELAESKAEIERLRKEVGRLMDAQRDYECPVLGDKELMSAVITAVMNGSQSVRNEACLKIQRHIIAVEKERDDRETECEALQDHVHLAERLREEMRTALVGAVDTIRVWHNMEVPEKERSQLWDIYWRNAPEMKTIRAVLGSARASEVKHGPE